MKLLAEHYPYLASRRVPGHHPGDKQPGSRPAGALYNTATNGVLWLSARVHQDLSSEPDILHLCAHTEQLEGFSAVVGILTVHLVFCIFVHSTVRRFVKTIPIGKFMADGCASHCWWYRGGGDNGVGCRGKEAACGVAGSCGYREGTGWVAEGGDVFAAQESAGLVVMMDDMFITVCGCNAAIQIRGYRQFGKH